MANITITDSGIANFITTTPSNYFTRANSGSAIELKGVSISYDISKNVDSTASPDSEETEIAQGSTNTPKVVISGLISLGKLDGSTTDLGQAKHLSDCVRTKGVKCLYYNDALTDETGYPILMKFLGVSDVYTNHPEEIHFHMIFTSFRITQDNNNNSKFTLTGEITSA